MSPYFLIYPMLLFIQQNLQSKMDSQQQQQPLTELELQYIYDIVNKNQNPENYDSLEQSLVEFNKTYSDNQEAQEIKNRICEKLKKDLFDGISIESSISEGYTSENSKQKHEYTEQKALWLASWFGPELIVQLLNNQEHNLYKFIKYLWKQPYFNPFRTSDECNVILRKVCDDIEENNKEYVYSFLQTDLSQSTLQAKKYSGGLIIRLSGTLSQSLTTSYIKFNENNEIEHQRHTINIIDNNPISFYDPNNEKFQLETKIGEDAKKFVTLYAFLSLMQSLYGVKKAESQAVYNPIQIQFNNKQ